ESRFGIKRDTPSLLEFFAHGRIIYSLIIGVDHRNQPRVRCALHIVLSAQRMQSRTRSTDVPGHETQRDQATGIVGASGVLGNAHAPEDHGVFCSAIDTSNSTYLISWHAGQLLD